MNTTTNTKPVSKDLLIAARYETRPNRYAGACDECGYVHEAGAARIVRVSGGQNWILLCRTMKCTKAHLARMRGSVGDSEEGRRGED